MKILWGLTQHSTRAILAQRRINIAVVVEVNFITF